MGWGHGVNYKDEEIGYLVPDVCNQDDCTAKIDRGLAYCCGDLEGVDGSRGCGGYFCYEHLFFSPAYGPGGKQEKHWDGQRCLDCAERIMEGGLDGEE